MVGSGDGGAVVVSVGGSDVAWVGAGSVGVVSVGVVSVGVVSVGAVSVGVVPVGLDDDVVGDEPVGEGALLSVGGVPVGDAVGGGVVPGTTGGAVSRIATISALNASSWVEICASEYDVMVLPEVGQPAPDVAEREQLLLARVVLDGQHELAGDRGRDALVALVVRGHGEVLRDHHVGVIHDQHDLEGDRDRHAVRARGVGMGLVDVEHLVARGPDERERDVVGRGAVGGVERRRLVVAFLGREGLVEREHPRLGRRLAARGRRWRGTSTMASCGWALVGRALPVWKVAASGACPTGQPALGQRADPRHLRAPRRRPGRRPARSAARR